MEKKPTTEMSYDELMEHNRYVRLLAETLEMEAIIEQHTTKKEVEEVKSVLPEPEAFVEAPKQRKPKTPKASE